MFFPTRFSHRPSRRRHLKSTSRRSATLPACALIVCEIVQFQRIVFPDRIAALCDAHLPAYSMSLYRLSFTMRCHSRYAEKRVSRTCTSPLLSADTRLVPSTESGVLAPIRSHRVGKISCKYTYADRFSLAGTPGPENIRGTRTLCSYMFCLPKSPCCPTARPLSPAKTDDRIIRHSARALQGVEYAPQSARLNA